MRNPTIYTSCIKQFWDTAKAKIVNGEVQIQALVNGKKVIVTETSVRRALQLKDAEGTECLPNATIFAELERMGYENLTQKLTFYKAFFSPQWKFLIHTILQCLSAKTTAWNEFSSTMASAIILFLDKQVEGMTKHKEIYVTPSHTKKVFANMKREGKGFSGRVTPLFQTMMPQKKQPKKKQRKDTKVSQPSSSTEPITNEAANEEHVPTHSNDPLLIGEDRLKLNELMELYTNLSQRMKVLGAQEDASKQGRKIADLDADAEVTLVDEAQGRNDDNLMFDIGVLYEQEVKVEKMIEPKKPLKKKDQILIDEEIAQKLQAQLNAELEEEEKLAKQRK
ncbi:hypothetical protein Tco_1224191 [Tanacetum coccineum]